MREPLADLARIVQAWGGRIVHLYDDEEPNIIPEHEPDIYADRENFLIYACDGCDRGALIHEVAHVFAQEKELDFYRGCEKECWGYFGWEFCLAKQIGWTADWLKACSRYGISTPRGRPVAEFSDLDPDAQSDLIEERVQYAHKRGLVVADMAIPLRTGWALPEAFHLQHKEQFHA